VNKRDIYGYYDWYTTGTYPATSPEPYPSRHYLASAGYSIRLGVHRHIEYRMTCHPAW